MQKNLRIKGRKALQIQLFYINLQTQRETTQALMAELVDALVSNTNGVKPVPVRSRLRAQKIPNLLEFSKLGIFIY